METSRFASFGGMSEQFEKSSVLPLKKRENASSKEDSNSLENFSCKGLEKKKRKGKFTAIYSKTPKNRLAREDVIYFDEAGSAAACNYSSSAG
ncbi:hypothetical protein CEXT_352451 [Caerostris extrusa]|uniref:Uncharacterized protein n=1 Tax=Caerostris extrusa TaxID=172846 RepID=A0AAV4XDG4_CAEEX|nr:hypothetical protein CEXT_352451 [Caerostris extrusa]